MLNFVKGQKNARGIRDLGGSKWVFMKRPNIYLARLSPLPPALTGFSLLHIQFSPLTSYLY